VREVTGFQSECFDSGFGKRPQRFNALIRGHDCCDNCFGLARISLGHEIDRAKGCAATSRFSCYQDNLTIRHGLIYHGGSAASMSHGAHNRSAVVPPARRGEFATVLQRRGTSTK
jgi:hypothetical protein